MEKIPRLTPDQRSNLVAYLDGELTEPATKEIDQVLGEPSPSFATTIWAPPARYPSA